MKQISNITILIMVLSIPFALSQTRKAIPAGRYEALSGAKSSHAAKAGDGPVSKDTLSLFWMEVTKHISQDKKDNYFYFSGAVDSSFKMLLTNKGALEVKNFDKRVNIYYSDDLSRDLNQIKEQEIKGSLIILKDKHSLKEIITMLGKYEVVIYQSESAINYFLLKLK